MAPMSPRSYVLPCLSLIALFSLWGIFNLNGAFATMAQNMAEGVLPNGDPLRTTYVGIGPVDAFLTNMVSFTVPVASPDFALGRLFLMKFLGELTPILTMMTVHGHTQGNPWCPTKWTTLWLFVYQVIGGGLVVPVYLFCRLRWPMPIATGRSVQASILLTLLPSIVVGYLFPAAMSFYASKPDETQFWTGIFQLFPVSIPLVQLFLSSVLKTASSVDSSWSIRAKNLLLRRTYLLMAFMSVAIHILVLIQLATHSDYGLKDFFVPNLQVDDFAAKVLVFLQFDYLIVMFAVMIWDTLKASATMSWTDEASTILAGLVFGPGAVAIVSESRNSS